MDGSGQINEWTDAILNAAYTVHTRLGPGFWSMFIANVLRTRSRRRD